MVKGTMNHASKMPTWTNWCWRLVPWSMFPRIASMAAVSGNAWTNG